MKNMMHRMMVFTICLVCICCYSNKDTIYHHYPKLFYETLKEISSREKETDQKFYLDIIKASAPALIAFGATILSVFFTFKQTKKQLQHSQKILLYNQEHENIFSLVEMISKYVSFFNLNQSNIVDKIKKGESISNEQLMAENALVILLTSDNDGGKELVDLINKYKKREVQNANDWLGEIISASNVLVTKKMANNEIKL